MLKVCLHPTGVFRFACHTYFIVTVGRYEAVRIRKIPNLSTMEAKIRLAKTLGAVLYKADYVSQSSAMTSS